MLGNSEEASEINLPDQGKKIGTEERLVAQLWERDQKAISMVYDAYAPALYGVISRIVKSEVLAEETLQECFLKIWNNFHQYDPGKGRLFTWFLCIARHLAIDKIRSQAYLRSLKTHDIANCADAGQITGNDTRPEDIGIRELTLLLPAPQKEIIDMLYFGGFSQQEVAEQLNIPLGTVKTRARSALKLLRKILLKTN